jgi:UDP-N-acetylglucosamine--N-acetylmuramyl-(pentapeptide) pyrophosphoryl-undecaprenol N-acetylglucosamine transferase
MKYLLAGGGTGGHVFPAIAIADEIKKIDGKAEILFIGAKGRIEEKLIPMNNYKLETINITGFDRKNIRSNLSLPLKAFIAMKDCRRIIKNFNPDVVIGTGGFVCGPVIFMANRMRYPTLIQEGNSFPGKTIKFLSGRVNKVIVNFEETKKYLKRTDNVERIAHPVRSSFIKIEKIPAMEYFNLRNENKTIFIFGGSQGARGINNAVIEMAEKFYDRNYNLIWQTGKNDFEKIKDRFSKFQDRIKVFEFIEKMDYAYSACDLVICRSGITSIMEIAFMNVASILIPFPHSAENHQEKNARSLEKEEAAEVILENDLSEKLFEKINALINNEEKLLRMKAQVSRISDSDAARKIAIEAINLIKN